MVAAIPHVSCYLLTSKSEAEQLVTQAVQHFEKWLQGQAEARSFIFFLGRENFPVTLFGDDQPNDGKDRGSNGFSPRSAGPPSDVEYSDEEVCI